MTGRPLSTRSRCILPPSEEVWFGVAFDPDVGRTIPAKAFYERGLINLVWMEDGKKLRAKPSGGKPVSQITMRPQPRPTVLRLMKRWGLVR